MQSSPKPKWYHVGKLWKMIVEEKEDDKEKEEEEEAKEDEDLIHDGWNPPYDEPPWASEDQIWDSIVSSTPTTPPIPTTLPTTNDRWDIFAFLRSADYYDVDDSQLPISVLPYLLSVSDPTTLDTEANRKHLADFLKELRRYLNYELLKRNSWFMAHYAWDTGIQSEPSEHGNTSDQGNTSEPGNTSDTSDQGEPGNTSDQDNTSEQGEPGNTSEQGEYGNTGNTNEHDNTSAQKTDEDTLQSTTAQVPGGDDGSIMDLEYLKYLCICCFEYELFSFFKYIYLKLHHKHIKPNTNYTFNDTLAGLAAKHGNLPMLEWIYEQMVLQNPNDVSNQQFSDSCMVNALWGVLPRPVLLLVKNYMLWPYYMEDDREEVNDFKAVGHIKCVHYIQSNWNKCKKQHIVRFFHNIVGSFDLGYSLTEAAAVVGNIQGLRYLYEHGHPLSDKLCELAIMRRHLDCLQFACDNGCVLQPHVGELAATTGDLDLLRYVHQKGCPLTILALQDAIEFGHLDCLKYIHENGMEIVWESDLCSYAAKYGQVKCLQYLHENGCPWNALTCVYAAMYGRLDCLQYAHEHGAPWGVNTCLSAAMYGRLDCLQYAHEHGAPWGVNICLSAACHGHLDCLKYAHENGCPWNKTVYDGAMLAKHIDCAIYARENGCPTTLYSEYLSLFTNLFN